MSTTDIEDAGFVLYYGRNAWVGNIADLIIPPDSATRVVMSCGRVDSPEIMQVALVVKTEELFDHKEYDNGAVDNAKWVANDSVVYYSTSDSNPIGFGPESSIYLYSVDVYDSKYLLNNRYATADEIDNKRVSVLTSKSRLIFK